MSRHNRLISREYREENQQVVFLLDCGRRMRTRDGDLAYFDHVLNAVLLLSYVALRQGDAVGAFTFSGEDRLLPPRKGRGAMNTLLNGLFDIQPTTSPSDFTEAASRISTRLRRRALVILVTNLRDEDAQELPAALAPSKAPRAVGESPRAGHRTHERPPSAPCQTPCGWRRQYIEDRQRAHPRRGRGVQTSTCSPPRCRWPW